MLLRTTGSGRLRAGSIAYDTLILDNVQTTATLDRGLITLNPVTAGLFGGQHRGSITVDARRTPAAFAIASDLEQVDANRLVSATTSLRDIIRGALGSNVRMNLRGRRRGEPGEIAERNDVDQPGPGHHREHGSAT